MALVTKNFSDIITFTRASGATYFDSNGVLQTAGNNVPRLDYNPVTLAAQGLLIEEQRTNSIRNNTMVGAVAGTPGTLPTNWQMYGSSGGLTQTIVGTGTENGITYIDIKYAGTTAGTATNSIYARPESNTQVAALSGQSWTQSCYVRLVGGSLTNITITVGIIEYSGAGAALAGSRTTITPTSNNLATQNYSHTRALNNASTAFVVGGVEMTFGSGVAIDITLRIGLPQLERGAFATSVIPTVNAFALGVTREADVASVNTLNPWFNQTEGTIYAELQSLSPLTAVQSVAAGKFPRVWSIEAGASDSELFWYGVGVEMTISTTYNNVGSVPSGINKFAVSLAASGGQSRSSLNGAAAVNRNGTLTGTATGFFLGRESTAGPNNFLNGWLRRLTYYPRALSAAELPIITA